MTIWFWNICKTSWTPGSYTYSKRRNIILLQNPYLKHWWLVQPNQCLDNVVSKLSLIIKIRCHSYLVDALYATIILHCTVHRGRKWGSYNIYKHHLVRGRSDTTTVNTKKRFQLQTVLQTSFIKNRNVYGYLWVMIYPIINGLFVCMGPLVPYSWYKTECVHVNYFKSM